MVMLWYAPLYYNQILCLKNRNENCKCKLDTCTVEIS